MKAFCALALAMLPFQAAMSQVTPAGKAERPQVNRDRALEARVNDRQEEVASYLRPEAKRKLETAARGVMERIRSGHLDTDFAQLARQEAQAKFGRLTPPQSDLLAFYILAETARRLARPEQMDEAVQVQTVVDAQQTVRLQEALDRESPLMTALGNVLKATADAQAMVLQKLK